MKYLNYRASDFAANEKFIEWVQHPTEETDAEWNAYLHEHPWQLPAVSEAREIILHLSSDPYPAADADLDEVWQKLTFARQGYMSPEEELPGETKVIPISSPKFRLLWVAAAAVLLLVSGYWLVQQRQETITYATAAGERLHLRLPDSSMVVLNNNTKLVLSSNWSANEDRVVQLEGQAFFSVTHKHNNQKFIVETADGLEVEVLGTEFSVSDKGNLNQVILESGSVCLNLNKDGEGQQLRMVPGELAEVTSAKEVVKKKVQPDLYNAWKGRKLVLEDKTLEDVASLLHHSYGYNVVITDASLKTQRITASLDNNTPDHILSILSETLEVDIQKQNNNITISSN